MVRSRLSTASFEPPVEFLYSLASPFCVKILRWASLQLPVDTPPVDREYGVVGGDSDDRLQPLIHPRAPLPTTTTTTPTTTQLILLCIQRDNSPRMATHSPAATCIRSSSSTGSTETFPSLSSVCSNSNLSDRADFALVPGNQCLAVKKNQGFLAVPHSDGMTCFVRVLVLRVGQEAQKCWQLACRGVGGGDLKKEDAECVSTVHVQPHPSRQQ